MPSLPTGFHHAWKEKKKKKKALAKIWGSVHEICFCLVEQLTVIHSSSSSHVTVHSVLSGKSKNLAQYLSIFWTTGPKRNALLLYPATALLLHLTIFSFYLFFSNMEQWQKPAFFRNAQRVADKCFSFLPSTTFMYLQIFRFRSASVSSRA